MGVPSRLAGVVSGVFLYGCLSARSYQPTLEPTPEPVIFIERRIQYVDRETDRSAALARSLCEASLTALYQDALKQADNVSRGPKLRCKKDWQQTDSLLAKMDGQIPLLKGCNQVGEKDLVEVTEQAIMEAHLSHASSGSTACELPPQLVAENYIPAGASSGKDYPISH